MAKRGKKVEGPEETAGAAGEQAVAGAGESGQAGVTAGEVAAHDSETVQGEALTVEHELEQLRAQLAEREAELEEIRRVVADAVEGVESETYRLTGKRTIGGRGFRYVRGTASETITRAQYVALADRMRRYFEPVEE